MKPASFLFGLAKASAPLLAQGTFYFRNSITPSAVPAGSPVWLTLAEYADSARARIEGRPWAPPAGRDVPPPPGFEPLPADRPRR